MRDRIERATGAVVTELRGLGGGCISEVGLVRFADATRAVAKYDSGGTLRTEAWMLEYLASNSALPVPRVQFQSDDLLLLEYIENDAGPLEGGAQRHAAELLAALHDVDTDRFGLERDTVIGGLHQPNAPSDGWLEFFAEQRLLYMGARARDAGAISVRCYDDIERLCNRLDRWLVEPVRPALLHGDMWGGNVLVREGRIVGFVDPAIYYGDAEVELAFSTLFSTFGAEFFSRYSALRPLDREFFEVRLPLYNLYPLLVHAVLFGQSYGRRVSETLERFLD